jgi:hypothetical protein
MTVEYGSPHSPVTFRIFQGRETKQTDSDGHPALDDKWYWEPDWYTGTILYSQAYNSQDECLKAMRRRTR